MAPAGKDDELSNVHPLVPVIEKARPNGLYGPDAATDPDLPRLPIRHAELMKLLHSSGYTIGVAPCASGGLYWAAVFASKAGAFVCIDLDLLALAVDPIKMCQDEAAAIDEILHLN